MENGVEGRGTRDRNSSRRVSVSRAKAVAGSRTNAKGRLQTNSHSRSLSLSGTLWMAGWLATLPADM